MLNKLNKTTYNNVDWTNYVGPYEGQFYNK